MESVPLTQAMQLLKNTAYDQGVSAGASDLVILRDYFLKRLGSGEKPWDPDRLKMAAHAAVNEYRANVDPVTPLLMDCVPETPEQRQFRLATLKGRKKIEY